MINIHILVAPCPFVCQAQLLHEHHVCNWIQNVWDLHSEHPVGMYISAVPICEISHSSHLVLLIFCFFFGISTKIINERKIDEQNNFINFISTRSRFPLLRFNITPQQ